MKWKRIANYLRYPLLAAVAVFVLAAAEHHGVVKFGAVPVPGATVTATQGDKKVVAVTDQDGAYSFPELADGVWNLQVDMLCFEALKKEIGVSAGAPPAEWSLKMLPLDQLMQGTTAPVPAPAGAAPGAAPGTIGTAGAPAANAPGAAPAAAAAGAATTTTASSAAPVKGKASKKGTTAAAPTQPGFQRAAVNATSDAPPPDTSLAGGAGSAADASPGGTSDALLVNGSVSTGIERRAIGNFRVGQGSLFTGNLSLFVDNSALDARPFSVSGQDTQRPNLSLLRPGVTVGGPLMIPHLFRYNGNFTVIYQGTRSRNETTNPTLMPTAAERGGDFSQVLNPLTGLPVTIYEPPAPANVQNTNPGCYSKGASVQFPGNQIPTYCFSAQAQALLAYYPQPNFLANSRYNYQVPLVSRSDVDNLQVRVNKNVDNKNFLAFSFNFSDTRGLNPTVFTFIDNSNSIGLNGGGTWRHTFNRSWTGVFGVNFSRSVSQNTPYFENRVNVSGKAGITGNDQTPENWGPPGLNFNSGLAGLSDSNESSNRNQTSRLTGSINWFRRPHQFTFGGDFSLLQFDPVSQSNPRGSFKFDGTATSQVVNGAVVSGTGSDFADFLLGIPDTSSIAFGNADKYFRTNSYDAYFNDNWTVLSTFTFQYGLRWEYNSPITEERGRLVNLDLGPGFSNPTPVVANSPVGAVSGLHYPDSLIKPYKRAFEPRVSFAWHPFFGASTIFRGAYGVAFDTSVYQTLANQMAQQSPLSKSLSVANSAADPLTLANGFNASPNVTTNTFAVDPNFRPGYSQNWLVSVQQNLTASMVLTAQYNGIKGTHAVQAFLPNTYPAGVVNPCAICEPGYTFLTSNGNSTREAASVNVRRRFHGGLSTTFLYTFSKSIDDAALGGRAQGSSVIAQNWLDLSAERGLSPFDQRHNLQINLQYSTGVGVHGGTLLSGWRGAIIKGWTIVSNITLGTGLPETPSYPVAVGVTGVSGPVRPEYDGQPLYATTGGAHFNINAFTAPPTGQWGNAGRDSLTGPNQFTMNAIMSRSFEKFDLTLNSSNPINHVTYPSWGSSVLSNTFGYPSTANGMRSLSATLRWRFP